MLNQRSGLFPQELLQLRGALNYLIPIRDGSLRRERERESFLYKGAARSRLPLRSSFRRRAGRVIVN